MEITDPRSVSAAVLGGLAVLVVIIALLIHSAESPNRSPAAN